MKDCAQVHGNMLSVQLIGDAEVLTGQTYLPGPKQDLVDAVATKENSTASSRQLSALVLVHISLISEPQLMRTEMMLRILLTPL